MTKRLKKGETVRRRGRPPIPSSKRTRPIGASVTPSEERIIRARGRGSFTAGVRFLLDYWRYRD